MHYTPDKRFTPEAMAAIADAGWTPESPLAKIMGRTWAILTRPHPTGGSTRLMIDVTGTDRRALTHDLPQWSAHLDALPAPADFPGFARAIERELLARGVRHHGWQVMGFYGGGISDLVTFEVKASENDAPADVVVNVSCRIDPAEAAATVTAGLRQAWDHVAAFDTAQSGDPLVERSAVVAAAAVATDAGHALEMLRVRAPIRTVSRFTLPADSPKSAQIAYRTLASERALNGEPIRPQHAGVSRMVRTAKGVTARTANGHFRWNGNTFAPRASALVPDTLADALAGRPLEDAVDHPAIRGSGLVIERAWTSPTREAFRAKVRSDLMTFAAAATLAETLTWQASREIREFPDLPIIPNGRDEEEADPTLYEQG